MYSNFLFIYVLSISYSYTFLLLTTLATSVTIAPKIAIIMDIGFKIAKDIKRTITIDIEKYGASSNKATKVTVSYSYSINKNGVRKTFPDPKSALKDD